MFKKVILELIEKSVLNSELHSRERLVGVLIDIINVEISLSGDMIRSNIGETVDQFDIIKRHELNTVS